MFCRLGFGGRTCMVLDLVLVFEVVDAAMPWRCAAWSWLDW